MRQRKLTLLASITATPGVSMQAHGETLSERVTSPKRGITGAFQALPICGSVCSSPFINNIQLGAVGQLIALQIA